MPWVEHSGVRAHFRGEDSPQALEAIVAIIEVLHAGAYCDLATREVHTPAADEAARWTRERLEREKGDRDG